MTEVVTTEEVATGPDGPRTVPRLLHSRAVHSATALLLSGLAGCSWSSAGATGCAVELARVALPEGLEETSGLAPADFRSVEADGAAGSTDSPGFPPVVWTHNDSGSGPLLVAIDLHGRTHGLIRMVDEAGRELETRDLEAMERAGCPEGSCLYVGDVGDNSERRSDAAILKIVVTGDAGGSDVARIDSESAVPVPASVLPIRFPDGPRDTEALYVLPGERIHIVTKGRSHPVTVYRYPLPLRPGEPVTLEEVQALTEEAPSFAGRITGAAAAPSGRIVVIRSYEAMEFHRVLEDPPHRLEPIPGGRLRLGPLREAQGEAVTILDDGTVVLSSEAGPAGRRGGLTALRCPGILGTITSGRTEAGARIGSTSPAGIPSLGA